jgi:hypothetical protein
MKANELRICSWVKHPAAVWSHRTEVQGYGYVEFQWEEHDWAGIAECTINLEDVKPIPLTEEWMLKFGFEYSDLNGDSGLWKIPPFQIYGKYNQFLYDYRLDVNYVHQLQNLYFALTYEELQTDESDKKVNQ